ncbi:STAS domain-containing protein [Nocardia flavorosea]|uniref:STAS domain-containing protein n=1 Tax=Nocardia flavorosea TaxID=53429 RepID=A0A846YQ20_9NOCA|nr:STAS domain-containing protein [Nocardia flavorosea]NKY59049.1 STAS domain-containing protein [Nocardia flavorosea]
MNPTVDDSPIPSTSASTPANSRLPGDQLSFRTRHRGEAVILSARGRADAATVPLWRTEVREAVEEAVRTGSAVIIDAGGLEFLSRHTVAALARDARRYRQNGTEIVLVTTDLGIAHLAAGDARTVDLPVRSTVVSALTAIRLRKRATYATSRPSPHRTPQITPEQHGAPHSGRTHYLPGEIIPGRGDLRPTVVATPLPRLR